jgi:hypothetical protein
LDIARVVVDLSVPDIFLPAQYFAQLESRERTPEQRLLLAMLTMALCDATQTHTRPDHRASAEAWIFSNSTDFLGFTNVCVTLGIEPGWLRTALIEGATVSATRIRRAA